MRSTPKGFTLIEILVVLGIAAIVLIFSMPFGKDFYQANQQEIIKNTIKNAVHYARSQSIIKGATLYLASIDSTEDWSNGLSLYELDNANHKTILHQWLWNYPSWQVLWEGFRSKKYIPFSPFPDQAGSNGTFKLSNRNTNQEVSVIVNRLGRVHS